MSHSINYELWLGRDRGEDFTVKATELTPLQNKMMDLAASVQLRQPKLNN